MSISVSSFGERLKYAREKANLTQEELAKKISCSRSLINHYENDRKKPRMANLEKLADALDMPQEFFIEKNVKVWNDEQFNTAQKALGASNLLNYAVVVGDAIENDISPEEIQEYINLIKKHKQKTQGS